MPQTEPASPLSEQPRNLDNHPVLAWLTALQVWTIFGLALSNAFLGLAVLGTVWVMVRRRGAVLLAELWRRSYVLLLPVLVYLLAFGVSAMTSVEPTRSFKEFLSAVFTLLGVPLMLLWIRGERRVRWMMNGLLGLIGVFALWGIGQFLFTDYGPMWNRIPGPFSHYMTFSGVLLVGVLALLPRLAVGSGWRKLHNWLLLSVIMLAMALTLTRHVWIATLAAFTIVVWVAARRWAPAYLAALLVAGIALSACAPDQWVRVRSIVDFDDASNYDRLCMTWAGARMIRERPFFGLGPGSVPRAYSIYRHPTSPRVDVQHLHNTLVQMAAERGLVEVGAFLWLMFVAWREGLRGYRRHRREGGCCADLYFTTFLSVMVLILAGLFEANWRDTEVNRLMLFLITIPWLVDEGDRSPTGAVVVADGENVGDRQSEELEKIDGAA